MNVHDIVGLGQGGRVVPTSGTAGATLAVLTLLVPGPVSGPVVPDAEVDEARLPDVPCAGPRPPPWVSEENIFV